MIHLRARLLITLLLVGSACNAHGKHDAPPPAVIPAGETVSFPSGNLTLHGSLHKPQGPGPFPAVLYNHGSAEGMISVGAANALGPEFTKRGWVLFMPYRRGQGLSSDAGPYILDEINAAEKRGGWRA